LAALKIRDLQIQLLGFGVEGQLIADHPATGCDAHVDDLA